MGARTFLSASFDVLSCDWRTGADKNGRAPFVRWRTVADKNGRAPFVRWRTVADKNVRAPFTLENIRITL